MKRPPERLLRSFGIFSIEEIESLRRKSVGIAGLGMGGSMFINLVRLGIGSFHIADPDVFERTNINRQRLARESTIGKRKDECLISEAKDISPEIHITSFPEGIQTGNVRTFLRGVDVVLDIVDVFALDKKMELHAEAREAGIPVISCACLAFAGSIVVFDDTTPSFAELTGMSLSASQAENLERFSRFICPEIPIPMREQLYRALNGETHIPFVSPGCEITAAMAATETIKVLLDWEGRVKAPYGLFMDPLTGRSDYFKADYRARRLAPLRGGKKAA